MDAGLTALLGAAVGSLATLGSAMVTGRAVHASDDMAEVMRRTVRDVHAGDTFRKAADVLGDSRTRQFSHARSSRLSL